ncbi:hypothetical protein ACJDU8_00110 [Clostridium sp. WILCCON 0269]|uniref:Uncharacterized protein n=1 Tax=Candidatus Clostridium eludens TaxID=3381663 RepID=A0ABW8SD83_9CLOT
MENIKQYLFISVILIFLSFIMFLIHYLIFGQLENTIYYSLMSLCFIPINILAVTLVFEKIVERHSRLERLSKLNMLVGLFFSDIGFALLKLIVAGDEKVKYLELNFNDLEYCKNKIRNYNYDIDFEQINYTEIKKIVIGGRDILSKLISNENILEHEIFSDLLMVLMHLRDEMIFIDHKELTQDDYNHLKGDIIRVYEALTLQWINYLFHLKQFYPYQYNSVIKYNPFTFHSQ